MVEGRKWMRVWELGIGEWREATELRKGELTVDIVRERDKFVCEET